MRTILILLCIFLSIRFIDNSQCVASPELAGYCGCCPIIGGSCVYFNTIDGIDVSWHLCMPEHLKNNFSLDQCQPNVTMVKYPIALCRTKYGIFRLFPQCTTKAQCLSGTPRRSFTPQCHTPTSVKGSCEKSIKSFSFDSTRGECVPFIYSGCGGSTNRFLRKAICEKTCNKTTSNTISY